MTPYPFKVYRTTGLEDAENEVFNHEGYLISFRYEVRDATGTEKVMHRGKVLRPNIPKFSPKARIYRRNKILVEAPELGFHDRGNDDEIIRSEGADQAMMDSLDHFRNSAIAAAKDGGYDFHARQRYYILEFPEDVDLSAKVMKYHRSWQLKKSKQDTELRPEPFPLAIELSRKRGQIMDGEKMITLEVRNEEHIGKVYWRVADKNKHTHKKGRTAYDDDSSEDEIEAAFAQKTTIS